MYRVVVAEDEPRILANLVKKIEAADPDFRVVATAANGEEALRKALECGPDLVVTDIVMPMMNGLDMIARLRAELPHVAAVIVSGYGEFPYAQRAIGLGVTDYLLKPVRAADVAAFLSRLRRRLELAGSALDLEEIAVDPSSGGAAVGGSFAAFLICFGSLCGDPGSFTPEHRAFLRSLREKAPAAASLDRLPFAHHRCWDVKETTPNLALVVASGIPLGGGGLAAVAGELQRSLRAAAAPYAVTVCVHAQPCPRQGLAARIEELHAGLARGLRVGESLLLELPAALVHEMPAALLPRETENELRLAAQRADDDRLRRIVATLLEGWCATRCTQVCMEQALGHLVRILQSALPGVTEASILAVEKEMGAIMVAAPGAEELVARIPPTLAELLPPTGGRLDAERIAGMVEEFLSRNYAQAVSLSDLSARLGFEESYLTRLFKARRGEPPIRWLTRLRVDRARHLLRERPELDIGDVGRIVGYPDQHYFSRVFRKITGENPSEFRARPTA